MKSYRFCIIIILTVLGFHAEGFGQFVYATQAPPFKPLVKAHFVGEYDTLGTFTCWALSGCPIALQEHPIFPHRFFPSEVTPPDYFIYHQEFTVLVFYTPTDTTTVSDYNDYVFAVKSIGGSCGGGIDTFRCFASVKGIYDSVVRIKPMYQKSILFSDSSLRKWTGKARFTFNNKTHLPAQFTDWKIILDTSTKITLAASHLGVPITYYDASALESEIPIDFELSLARGPILDSLLKTAILETHVFWNGRDSVHRNRIDLTIYPAKYAFRGGVSLDSLYFENRSNTHDEKKILFHLDPTTKSYKLSPLSHPFSFIDNPIDSLTRELTISCDPKSGGRYREFLKLFNNVADFNGDARLDSCVINLTAQISDQDDTAFWEFLPNSPNKIIKLGAEGSKTILASSNKQLFVSQDKANSWISVSIPDSTCEQFVIDRAESIYRIGRNRRVYKSINLGATWKESDSGISGNADYHGMPYTFPLDVQSIALDSKDRIFATAIGVYTDPPGRTFYGSGLFLSSDNGHSWKKADPQLYNNFYGRIFFDSSDYILFLDKNHLTNLFYIRSSTFTDSLRNFAFGPVCDYLETQNKGMLSTSDSGRTWEKLGLDLPDVRAIAVATSGDIFIASYGNGVFRSTDNGKNWEGVNGGLTTNKVNDIIAVPGEPLYLATEDAWVWKSKYIVPLKNAVRKSEISNNIIFELSPNPASSRLTVHYSLPENISGKLSLCDILGNDLGVFDKNKMIQGDNSIPIDLSNVHAGIYFCKLQTTTATIVKKVIRF
ncbi:MAG: T9SS type A sorting domain-containing protein [Ignavibacteriota bacterium]